MSKVNILQHIIKDEAQVRQLLKMIDLQNTADFARRLDWELKKVSTYAKRGILPEPVITIGNRPVWLKSQIEEYVKKRGAEK